MLVGGNPFFPLHYAASDVLGVVAVQRGCSTAGKSRSALWDWENELTWESALRSVRLGGP